MVEREEKMILNEGFWGVFLIKRYFMVLIIILNSFLLGSGFSVTLASKVDNGNPIELNPGSNNNGGNNANQNSIPPIDGDDCGCDEVLPPSLG